MKYTLITGASKGIGRALALKYAKQNHNLILTARNIDELRTLQNELNIKHPSILIDIIVQNLAELNGPENIFKHCNECNYQINVLINNAGLGDFQIVSESDINKQLNMIDVNIRSLTE